MVMMKCFMAMQLAAVCCVAVFLPGCAENEMGPVSVTENIRLELEDNSSGPVLYTGDSLLVEWTANKNAKDGFDVLYRTGSENAYTRANESALGPEVREYLWVIPDSVFGDSVVVKVEAIEGEQRTADTSTPFVVVQIPDITMDITTDLSAPWSYAGDQVTIEWSGTADPIEGFTVHLSLDSGFEYSQISDGLLSPGSRSMTYSVSGDKASRSLFLVRAHNASKTTSALSDTFTMNKPIRITTNLAGEVFTHDDDIDVEWLVDTNKVEQGYLVHISPNSGADFYPAVLGEALERDETYTTILIKDDENGDPIDSDQCWIRVSEYDNPSNFDLTGPFTLRP